MEFESFPQLVHVFEVPFDTLLQPSEAYSAFLEIFVIKQHVFNVTYDFVTASLYHKQVSVLSDISFDKTDHLFEGF